MYRGACKIFWKRWGIRYNQMYTFFFRELISSLWKFWRITLFSQGNRVKDQLNLEQPGLSSMHHRPESRLAQSRAHFSKYLEVSVQPCLKLLFYKIHFHSKRLKVADFGLLGTISHQGSHAKCL